MMPGFAPALIKGQGLLKEFFIPFFSKLSSFT